MEIRKSTGEKLFDTMNIILLSLLSLAAIIPLLHVVAGSFSSANAIIHSRVTLWPVEPTLDHYKLVTQTKAFWEAGWLTIRVVVLGTLLNMVLTIIGSYPLSKPYLRGRRPILLFIVFTMIFHAPMIPMYLVVKEFGMLNTIWALIVPTAISAFNMMLCITFFRGLPEEMFDAAKVDGMNDYRIVWSIVTPLSKPILVTLLLFYAVGHWNNYFTPLLYINDRDMQTLQVYLYNLISLGSNNDMASAAAAESSNMLPQALEMATIVLATLPIVVLYPFLQKHFVKGATLGSVKE
ncbi:carbohydrate ABC transporter permease [Paenibacillus sp. JSM ZJ436]|uniref:Binding-protein-dependent transport systems inner membrane component n=1 Tax=Paenibacillus algicola TaxID=2565926 RepID=A0A4P8XTK0_9BACL|nr:carbohydrate ABC transporter permease [Paenibacillus algicola]QCT04049.1 binding-protein-dependent transport systems inner membrane component [Paenibacillus algicola]